MGLFENKTHNAVATLTALIKELQIPVSKYTVSTQLQDHPDYPSLLAFSDCLSDWSIPHEAYRIDKKEYNAADLSFPLIAHMKQDGGQFILIHEIKNGQVTYTNEENKKAVLPEETFLKGWDGVILYAQKGEQSGEADYKNANIKGLFNEARLPFLVLVLLTFIVSAIGFSGSISWAYIAVLALKIAGITVSALLLMHSVDANNPFIENLCSLGKKNNCNAILKSDAAKVTSWLSWSEVGMFYFAGSFIAMLAYPATIPLLAILNLACLPYSFYSIGYQIKIKNWCILCCSVQALFWLEAAGFAIAGAYSFNIPTAAYIALALCFLLPIAIWSFIKPFMLQSGQTGPLKQQLKKFKYNSELFQQLLTAQPKYSVPDDLMPVVMGNPDAETVITMVSNPFCGPCATAHKTIEDWLENRDDIKVKVVFTTANHDNDERTKVARHVTALSLLDDKKIAEKALNDWYAQSNKKYEDWASKFPVSFNGEMNTVTEKQKAWCDMAEISFTPTILVNGYKLVDPYRLEDIKYLLA